MSKIIKDCSTCKYAGWDPDGNYCAAPKVLKKHSWGRTIHTEKGYIEGVEDFCEPPKFPLWEKDDR